MDHKVLIKKKRELDSKTVAVAACHVHNRAFEVIRQPSMPNRLQTCAGALPPVLSTFSLQRPVELPVLNVQLLF